MQIPPGLTQVGFWEEARAEAGRQWSGSRRDDPNVCPPPQGGASTPSPHHHNPRPYWRNVPPKKPTVFGENQPHNTSFYTCRPAWLSCILRVVLKA